MQMIRALLILSLFLPTLAHGHDGELKPCGKVTRSIKLKSDCSAPLIVAADNVTINLGGHTVRNIPPGFDGEISNGVEVINRNDVTIKNGTIIGPRYGLFVSGGRGHTFRDLDVTAEGDPEFNAATAVAVEEVEHTLLRRIKTTPGSTLPVFIFIGSRSQISDVTTRGAYIFGDALLISNNNFNGGKVGPQTTCGLAYAGQRSMIRGNMLTTPSTNLFSAGLCVEGNNNSIKRNIMFGSRAGLGLIAASTGNVISNNKVSSDPTAVPGAVDIRGGDNACGNTWKNNKFKTDSEGDGHNEGCIQ